MLLPTVIKIFYITSILVIILLNNHAFKQSSSFLLFTHKATLAFRPFPTSFQGRSNSSFVS